LLNFKEINYFTHDSVASRKRHLGLWFSADESLKVARVEGAEGPAASALRTMDAETRRQEVQAGPQLQSQHRVLEGHLEVDGVQSGISLPPVVAVRVVVLHRVGHQRPGRVHPPRNNHFKIGHTSGENACKYFRRSKLSPSGKIYKRIILRQVYIFI